MDLVTYALNWVGREFNPGTTAQCAEFVSTCLDATGFLGKGYHHTSWAPDFHEMGDVVNDRAKLLPGDIVLLDRTYDDGSGDLTFTHVGIYVGSGYMVHRPTSAKPVEKTYILEGFYEDKFHEGRRLLASSSNPSTPNDGKGANPYPVKIFWHDGLLAVIVDGKEVLKVNTKNVGEGKLCLPSM